jgi:hypothetical protein
MLLPKAEGGIDGRKKRRERNRRRGLRDPRKTSFQQQSPTHLSGCSIHSLQLYHYDGTYRGHMVSTFQNTSRAQWEVHRSCSKSHLHTSRLVQRPPRKPSPNPKRVCKSAAPSANATEAVAQLAPAKNNIGSPAEERKPTAHTRLVSRRGSKAYRAIVRWFCLLFQHMGGAGFLLFALHCNRACCRYAAGQQGVIFLFANTIPGSY